MFFISFHWFADDIWKKIRLVHIATVVIQTRVVKLFRHGHVFWKTRFKGTFCILGIHHATVSIFGSFFQLVFRGAWFIINCTYYTPWKNKDIYYNCVLHSALFLNVISWNNGVNGHVKLLLLFIIIVTLFCPLNPQ